VREELLKIWAAGHTRSFKQKSTLVGGKHPSFCLMGDELLNAWDSPFFISVERDEDETVNSLVKRNWGWPLDTCLAITGQLLASREAFLSSTDARVHRVEFQKLRESPKRTIGEIADFLSFSPSPEVFARTLAFIR